MGPGPGAKLFATIEDQTYNAEMTDLSSPALALIIPTRNMAESVRKLLDSVFQSGFSSMLEQIVVVNDGSTDGTLSMLEEFRRSDSMKTRGAPKFDVVSWPVNQGRFMARLRGLEAATSSHVLFLDSRIVLDSDFVAALRKHFPEKRALMGAVRIDEEKSIFNLYWKRSHERLFAKSIPREDQPHWISAENYGEHVVGTTVVLGPKQTFLNAYAVFGGRKIENDDTALLEHFVKEVPIFRTKDFEVSWEPRQKLAAFLWHLLKYRGLTFAEYHLFVHWSRFSWIFLAGVGLAVAILGVAISSPWLGVGAFVLGLILVMGSVFLISKNLVEGFRLMFLHLLVIAFYGTGILAGVFRILFRRIVQTSA